MNTRKQLTEAEIVGDYAAIRGQITQILLPMERCEKGKHLIQPLAGTTLGIVYAVDSPMERKLIPITWTMVETVCLLGKRKPDTTVKIGIDMKDYRRIRDAEKAE